jgi:hypothetical protein
MSDGTVFAKTAGMRRLLEMSVALVALAAAGCAPSLSVSSHVQRDLNFGQYRTYDWGPSDALPTGDARLDANPLFSDYVHGAIERELAAKGLELAEASAKPDLLIHYHATVADRLDVNTVDQKYGYCLGADCPPDTYSYEAGTLVVDFMDARTNRLVWRGWAQSRLSAFLEDPDRMQETVRESIAQMMRQLPRELGQ